MNTRGCKSVGPRMPAAVRSYPDSDRNSDLRARLVKCQSATSHWLLFNHLVGDLLEMQRHVEAHRLGGLEVDD